MTSRAIRGIGGAVAALLLAAPCLAAQSAPATERCVWHETTGEASPENTTAEEARSAALRAARLRAVEAVAGVELQAHTLVRDHALAGQFLLTLVYGRVLEQRTPRWETIVLQENPPITLYRVHLAACVAPEHERRDPRFSVTAELNKRTFVTNERATIRMRCSQACYLSILNLVGRDEFSLLLPNRWQQSPRVPKGTEVVFPRDGMPLVMEPEKGHPRSTEAFLVVATKGPLDLGPLFQGRERVPFTEVSRLLLDVPASERTEALLVYEVRER